MTRFRVVPVLLLALTLGGAMSLAHAQKDSARPEVGKPLQEAQKLLQARKFKEALGPIAQAEAVGGLTDYERFIVAQMKGSALAGAGDADGAALALEPVLKSQRLPADEQLRITEAVAGTYLRARNYRKALEWLEDYRERGGKKPEVLALIPQAHYFAGDYAKAASEFSAVIAAVEKSGGKPSEEQIRFLASSYDKQKDSAGYLGALETMARHYPRPEVWNELIVRAANRPGFARSLDLDRYRLQRATGTLTRADDVVQAAQLAILDGLPGEAQAIVEDGYARKILGVGDAGTTERQNRLKAHIEGKVAEDRKTIASTDADAAKAAGGDPLLRTGLAYVTYGDTAKGLSLMEQGVQKGGLKSPEAARLHLGYAYQLAGQKDKALAAFKSVKGDDGAADLARIWSLLISQR